MDSQKKIITNWDFEAGEILNIHKPAGLTSFDVVARIRKWSGCRKVGHAGTLDPNATGVLLICTGKATKRVSELMEMEKEYIGVIELGKCTDSDDIEGKIICQKEVPLFEKNDILTELKKFEGDIQQVPPMFSALKYKGHRLYQLARQGKTVPRAPRIVSIREMTLLDWENPCVHIRVRCSRGTYIRAIARDLGAALDTGGYLKELCRTKICTFTVDQGLSLEEFKHKVMDERESISIH